MSLFFFVFLACVLVLATVLVFASARWHSATKATRIKLEAARVSGGPSRFDSGELAGLPTPVVRYFRHVLGEGQPLVAAVRLEQKGTMNMRAQGQWWRPFAATQRVEIKRPGFDWDARISLLPGLIVRVRDAYVAGEGLLQASLYGLLNVVQLRGRGAIGRDELMRYLAEAPLYPTALLPSQGVQWEPEDAQSAWATLKDGPHAVSLLFSFAPGGEVDSVWAPDRGRAKGREVVPTPWLGRWWNYAQRDGLRIPLAGEVLWQLEQGEHPYWRGELTELRYTFSSPSEQES